MKLRDHTITNNMLVVRFNLGVIKLVGVYQKEYLRTAQLSCLSSS